MSNNVSRWPGRSSAAPRALPYLTSRSPVSIRLRATLRAELAQLQRKVNVTAMCVSHDRDDAATLGDRAVQMREGRIIEIGDTRRNAGGECAPRAGGTIGANCESIAYFSQDLVREKTEFFSRVRTSATYSRSSSGTARISVSITRHEAKSSSAMLMSSCARIFVAIDSVYPFHGPSASIYI